MNEWTYEKLWEWRLQESQDNCESSKRQWAWEKVETHKAEATKKGWKLAYGYASQAPNSSEPVASRLANVEPKES